MKKIYSILVAYNPDLEELNQAVERLKKQTDIVIVCNNSDYDVEFEGEQVKVFNFGENLGIAKAQSIGMKWAFENGADFILQMDQDSIPNDDLVEKLLECYEELTEKGYKVGLVGSQDYDKDTKKESIARYKKGILIQDTEYISVEQILSSGSLISIETYNIIGGMDDKLFIDAVDFEYCWRILQNKMFIIKNPKALIAHKLGNGNRKILSLLTVGVPSPIRHYYQVRNTLLLINRSYAPFYWKYSNFLKVVFKIVIYPFILDRGFLRFSYMMKGLKDGILGKSGKINE